MYLLQRYTRLGWFQAAMTGQEHCCRACISCLQLPCPKTAGHHFSVTMTVFLTGKCS